MTNHSIVSRQQWLDAHAEHLVKEKQVTHQREALAAARRDLPWIRVEKDYRFHDAQASVSLGDLFDGKSQLIIKHFMFGPDWQEGCVGCSFEMDHLQGTLVHLANHDVSVVAVSRGPFAALDAFRRRMGWSIRWVSSAASDFNRDFHVSFDPEDIVDGKVFHNFAWEPSFARSYRALACSIATRTGGSITPSPPTGVVPRNCSAAMCCST